MRDSIHRTSSKMPSATQGVKIAWRYENGESVRASPRCFTPHVREKFPNALLRMTSTANARVFHRNRPSGFIGNALHPLLRLIQRSGPHVRDVFLALGTQTQVGSGLFVQALALGTVENGLAHGAPGGLGAEVIFAVKTLHPLHHLGLFQNAGIEHVRKLVTLLVG